MPASNIESVEAIRPDRDQSCGTGVLPLNQEGFLAGLTAIRGSQCLDTFACTSPLTNEAYMDVDAHTDSRNPTFASNFSQSVYLVLFVAYN